MFKTRRLISTMPDLASGSWVFKNKHRFLDLTSNYGKNNVGYACPEVIEDMIQNNSSKQHTRRQLSRSFQKIFPNRLNTYLFSETDHDAIINSIMVSNYLNLKTEMF